MRILSKFSTSYNELRLEPSSSKASSRREIIGSGAVLASWLSFQQKSLAKEGTKQKIENLSYAVYHVNPDPSQYFSPTLSKSTPELFVTQASLLSNEGGGAIWLGEHHNSKSDHELQATLIRQLYNTRKKQDTKMAIGLEQVQIQFQPVLDAFIAGEISEENMLQQVKWTERWSWPYEPYRPIFQTAVELGIRLIALNVDSEDLAKVEKGGYPLLRERLSVYIKDPVGFSNFATSESFKEYANYVIRPSYTMHERMGILKSTVTGQTLEENMSYANFLSGRMLWDETMASVAARWCDANPNGVLIGCVGLDHVKFRNGIPARFSRLMSTKRQEFGNLSVLLNPNVADTRPPGTTLMSEVNQFDRIILQLRYLVDANVDDRSTANSNVLPVADYLLLSET